MHKTLPDLIESLGGADFAGEWPYLLKFPDGERFVCGKSPKDAAAKALESRRCTKEEVIHAAFEALGRKTVKK